MLGYINRILACVCVVSLRLGVFVSAFFVSILGLCREGLSLHMSTCSPPVSLSYGCLSSRALLESRSPISCSSPSFVPYLVLVSLD